MECRTNKQRERSEKQKENGKSEEFGEAAKYEGIG
jgi:hypothetical protein